MHLWIKLSILIFMVFTLIYLFKYRKDKYIFGKYIAIILSLGFLAMTIIAAIVDDIQFVAIGVTFCGYFLGYFYE